MVSRQMKNKNGTVKNALDIGETEYQSNRFLYRKNENESFINTALYVLEHSGYEILEIKE